MEGKKYLKLKFLEQFEISRLLTKRKRKKYGDRSYASVIKKSDEEKKAIIGF